MRYRLLALLLRVPLLHLTVSRRFLLLGGLDGQPLSPPVAVRYAVHDEDVIALAPRSASWWRGLSAERAISATVRMKGRAVAMIVTLASGEALDQGILRYLQKYPGEWKALGIDAGANPEDVETAAHGSAVVLFRAA